MLASEGTEYTQSGLFRGPVQRGGHCGPSDLPIVPDSRVLVRGVVADGLHIVMEHLSQ